MFHFYTTSELKKNRAFFLTLFLGGMEMEHWFEIG